MNDSLHIRLQGISSAKAPADAARHRGPSLLAVAVTYVVLFVASAASRVQFLGRKVAGIHIAFFGGTGAFCALTLSSLGAWILSQRGALDSPPVVRVLHLLCFAAGGPGYVVPFGLLAAGISLVAGLQGFIPRWLFGAMLPKAKGAVRARGMAPVALDDVPQS